MNHFPSFSTGLQLIEGLVSEESVFCLPGECFDYPDYMRMVLTVPIDLMREACQRIAGFFTRYYVHGNSRTSRPIIEITDDVSNGNTIMEDEGDDRVIECLPVAGIT